MEIKKIKISKVIDFIDKIKNNELVVRDINELDYLSWIKEQLRKLDLNREYDRVDLQDKLKLLVWDYDDYLCDKDVEHLGLDRFEVDNLHKLNSYIVKALLPNWKDTTRLYCNIGKLVEKYDLDIDELYFDGDTNCIRDDEGNVWFD